MNTINVNSTVSLQKIISLVPTFWDSIPISQLWAWLPSDLQLAIDYALSVFAVLGMIKLFRSIIGSIGSIFGFLG